MLILCEFMKMVFNYHHHANLNQINLKKKKSLKQMEVDFTNLQILRYYECQVFKKYFV